MARRRKHLFGTFIIFRSSGTKFLVSPFGPFIHTVRVSLPPRQALGEACTETERRVGEGRREKGLHAQIGRERGVLCHAAEEPAQRRKTLS